MDAFFDGVVTSTNSDRPRAVNNNVPRGEKGVVPITRAAGGNGVPTEAPDESARLPQAAATKASPAVAAASIVATPTPSPRARSRERSVRARRCLVPSSRLLLFGPAL